MPTFYCNYFLLGTRGPLTLGGPWTLPPCLPHCYATAYDTFSHNSAACVCAGGSQGLPPHLAAGFHHYSGLYSDMYGHHHASHHHHHQQQQQQSAVPPASRGFFTPDLPVVPPSPIPHHHLPRIDNSVLTYLSDVTANSNSNGQY